MPKDKQPYDVGYRKPPASGRFAKGKSGNPQGRPKGSQSLKTIVLKECNAIVPVNGPHGRQMMTKLRAGMMQLINKAAQGDLRALRELIALVQWAEDAVAGQSSLADLSQADQKMMQSFLRRIGGLPGETGLSGDDQ